MAYLTFAGSEERQNSCFKFIGADANTTSTGLISENTSLISANSSLLSETLANGGMDTCSFYAGPSDSQIFAFGENFETAGSIAYSNAGGSCGSIAYSAGTESCGSIASSSVSSCSGSACSYSC